MQRKSIIKLCMFFILATTALFMLGGCSDGTNGADGTKAAPVNAAVLTADQWAALAPKGEVTSVTINSSPVVKFKVTDANGNPISGLGFTSQNSTAVRPGLTNLVFTIAKLVQPATGSSEPSKWVNYVVLKSPSYVSATDHTIKAEAGSYPTTDNIGTLKDNGDGSYEYTFYRDIRGIKAIVDGLTDSGYNKKADLGDLTFDPTLTHRVGIQISGNARGTGSNTANGVTTTTAVPMLNPLNLVYDFIPATGQAVTATDSKRDIVLMASCQECHGTKGLAHGGGRNNPRYCVTCHTDQIIYSFNAGEATSTNGGMTLTGTTRPTTAIVDGRALGNFPNMIHKIHMGNKLLKKGYFFNADDAGKFNDVAYPQDVRNCTKCHTASPTAPQGDNWKNVPSKLACGSCHDGVTFDGIASKSVTGAAMTHETAADGTCILCHNSTTIPVQHALPVAVDASKRTMKATITGAAVDSITGNVTVTFTMMKGTTPVTDPYATLASFKSAAFTLAKLVPGTNGASSNWVSYTGKSRTKDATKAPVIQGYSETVVSANLTHMGSGVWTYTFALPNADTAGDIRTVTHVHNGSATTLSPATYTPANHPTDPNVVAYDAASTHRVGMEFSENADGTGNTTNATYDFVPNGSAVTLTRDIVNIASCQGCHAGNKLHKGYDTKYCVTCHNSSTFNPWTNGANNNTVDLQTIIHKIHMGTSLTDRNYSINGLIASDVAFPSKPNNCLICHNETSKDGANWRTTPTKEACGACHDSTTATAHIDGNIYNGVQTCVTCHGVGKIADVQVIHNK